MYAQNLEIQLIEFKEAWQRTYVKEHDIKSKALDFDMLTSFFSAVSPIVETLKSARKTGATVNIWQLAGLGFDEVRISAILAWLLDCYAEHGQKHIILSNLLNSIKTDPSYFPDSTLVTDEPYWVNVETCPSGAQHSRVDIEIEGEKFLLFIEVKIYAPETNDQLSRYLEIGNTKSGGRPWGVIFLTPDGHSPKNSTKNEHLKCLSWRVVSKVFKKHAQTLEESCTKLLLTQFANYISKF